MPFPNRKLLVGVIHIAERIVDGNGLDLAGTAELPEPPNQDSANGARGAIERQPVLPQVVAPPVFGATMAKMAPSRGRRYRDMPMGIPASEV